MSLFDVIRYPVTDIYDAAQLKGIPQPIIDDWEDYIADLHSIVKDKTLNSPFLIRNFVMLCVFEIAHELSTRPDCKTTMDEYANQLKNTITNHLIQLIKDYDNELV